MRFSFSELKRNDPLRLAGATAFFSTFALPPILIILTHLFGLFLNRNELNTQLIGRLANLLGKTSADQVQQVLTHFDSLSQNLFALSGGFLFLIFVATTLFSVIKNSLDQIWKIRVKAHPGLWFYLKLRGRSLMVILLAGLLFIILIFIESMQAILGEYITYLGPRAGNFLNGAVSELIFIAVVTVWFSVIFRFLTDGRPKWEAALAGGFFTAVLFSFGKVILKSLLSLSNISNIYGASGSMVLILLFVFYSSLIFYYGGCFIKAMSDDLKLPIRPVKEAFRYQVQEVFPEEQP
ncbi:YihY/virulence factor BrkB family protein [Paradesertivirga mongoliensis]|uniref:YihY/virulence factor BrkB family protein n=2 Tax=Paradesertivirga mongoliensis TaxID=2100740 RepID=A0ABW4ZMZ5_9SPHI|nr:YihY/virulence factor BrkB family protein [Pedobacter mongoliensis]